MRNLTIAMLAAAAVLAIALMTRGGLSSTAHAATDCVEVFPQEWYVCLTLEPDMDSNPVGTTHTVKATLTEGNSEAAQSPYPDQYIDFSVVAGPNSSEALLPQCYGIEDTARVKGRGVPHLWLKLDRNPETCYTMTET